jgi:uncharacterized protein
MTSEIHIQVPFAVRFAAVDTFVEDVLGDDTSGHDADHCRRVAKMAVLIAGDLNKQSPLPLPVCDVEVVYLAAMLHDVWDHKICLQPSLMRSRARQVLLECGIKFDDVDRIFDVIERVSWSKGVTAGTTEAACVQDADRLDAIGAIGIARVFAYGGSKNRHLRHSVEHFNEKLLLIKSRMNTALGSELAEKRHQLLVDYLWSLRDEGFGVES